ncbi:MAG TPA: aminotransferase class V-fold PLP-dependent enzyme [Methanocorpusculum sp.]|nr:aminotransferase class V-fold PLP-dependent enzyme [Methanocorpusculum sp.]
MRADIMKWLFWCPKCNIPLIAKTCFCNADSIKIPLQQPYDVRPALEADYALIRRLVQDRFGEKVTLPKILVLNKEGGLDRNDLIIANGIRFARLSFNPVERRFAIDIETEALPFFIGKADKGIINLETDAQNLPEGRLGGKKVTVENRGISDGCVIVQYKNKYGTGILKGNTLKIKEIGSVEQALTMPNPGWDEVVEKNAFHLKNLERTAVREIRANLSLKPKVNCSFSGGKDSTAVWHIAQKAGVTEAFFIDTGLEFPETIEFVKSQNVQFIEKAGNFWQAVEKAGPPAKDHRWCCKLLKLNPLKVHLAETGECLTVQGNRWYESWNRAGIEAVTQNPANPLQMNVSPIRSWRALDVFLYLWLRKIPYNPLYARGYERIGCYLCPAMLESELETMHRTHPEMAARWDAFLKKWADERGLPREFIEWGLWRWKELPPKMQEIIREKKLNLSGEPIRRSTPASVAALMPKGKAGDVVEIDEPEPAPAPAPAVDVEKLRADFPMIGEEIYFDSGATAFSPRGVIHAYTDFEENYRANVGRGVHRLTRIATQKYWHAHEKIASFIGGEEGITVFTKNTTEAVNIVARGLDIRPGDVIVVSVLEHHSNLLPWRALRDFGAVIKVVGLREDLTLDMDALRAVFAQGGVRLAAVTHASNVCGTVTPVPEIAALCKEYGALLFVDGAQAAPHMKLDMKELGCNFYAFSGHKMYGPTGTGVLWMKEDILKPSVLGGGMIESVSDTDFVPAKGFHKFEAGTPHIAGGIALGAAADYLVEIGMDKIAARERMLTQRLIDGLEKIEGVHLYVCKDERRRIGAVSFTVDGYAPHEIAEWLDDEHGIAVRSGMHCAEPLMRYLGAREGTVRVCVSFLNTEAEIDTLAAVLKELCG